MKENIPLKPDQFYHIYNRGNNKENLFNVDKNYHFFLKKWQKYLDDFIDVWAYCLMSNHFHFLVRVKKDEELKNLLPDSKIQRIPDLVSNQLRKLFISYTKSFNKTYDRTGSLFQKPFKRVKVNTRNYLKHLIHYIHHNPIHHGFVENYRDWPYSSYHAIISQQPSKIKRQRVLNLFGGQKSFFSYHQEMKNYNVIDHLIFE